MLTITISDTQIEQRLVAEAAATGVAPSDLARDILSRSLTSEIPQTASDLTEEEFASLLKAMAIPGSIPVPLDADIREIAYGD